ncbi:MAG: trypsin-like peptidase domain-containing protein [archaeon]|nr:trypsin-like peptidase domain-containing protein [archaeon]
MTLAGIEEEITQAVQKLSESVVNIEATVYARGRRFGGIIPVEGSGSGVIFDLTGHVITNNHVVDSADVVTVSLKDGRVFGGKVIGSDGATDIAVVELEANDRNLPYATLGDSEHLKVGQIALAIGNSLGLPGGPTVSLGVVSALARPLPGADFIYEGFIQTDAAINPGNSGGPLANLQGEIIGINTAIIPYANGMGFAIPVNMVRHVAEQILEKGRVIRPWIGISAVEVNPAISRRYDLRVDTGLMVIGVSRYSPADEAGLRQGDVITGINGHETKSMKDLLSEISKLAVGSGVRLATVRLGNEMEISLRLVEMPARLYSRR